VLKQLPKARMEKKEKEKRSCDNSAIASFSPKGAALIKGGKNEHKPFKEKKL